MKALITFLFIIVSFPIIACSCIGKATVKQEFKESVLVISGEVVSGKEVIRYQDSLVTWFEMEYKIKVINRFKGKIKSDTVTIRTGLGDGDCGYNFQVGLKYLVYGEEEPLIHALMRDGSSLYIGKGYFRTDVCTRTRLLSEAEEDLTFLNKKLKQKL